MAMSSAKPALTPDAVEDALRSSETYFTEAADIFLLEKGAAQIQYIEFNFRKSIFVLNKNQ